MITLARIFFLTFGFLLIGFPLGAADVFLGASKDQVEKITIWTPPFLGLQGGGQTGPVLLAESILKKDMIRSQLFDVIDFVKEGAPVDFTYGADKSVMALAKESGILAIAWAKLYPSSGKWVMEAYAYETGRGDPVIRVKMTAETVHPLAHRFSDKLVSHFTGEKGIAETKIAYLSDQTKSKEIYVMDYDGQNETRLTSERSIVLSPRWSFDATKIGYTSYSQGTPAIYFLDLASGFRKKVFSAKGLSFSPAWSPSGTRRVFTSTKDGNAEIYLMDETGEAIRRLTFHSAADLSPTWSPTGQEIAFTSDRGGSPQIYIMDSEGGNIRRLTYTGDYNTSASWSPLGDWVVYTCRNRGGLLKLCANRVSGQEEVVKITEEGAWDDEAPSWAPNGREIAFTSNRFGKDQVFVIRPDGTGLIQLTSNGGRNTSPAWAPR